MSEWSSVIGLPTKLMDDVNYVIHEQKLYSRENAKNFKLQVPKMVKVSCAKFLCLEQGFHNCYGFFQVIKSATGKCTETMIRETWDVGAFVGQRARVKLVDFSSGGWGHINFDDLRGDMSCGLNWKKVCSFTKFHSMLKQDKEMGKRDSWEIVVNSEKGNFRTF